MTEKVIIFKADLKSIWYTIRCLDVNKTHSVEIAMGICIAILLLVGVSVPTSISAFSILDFYETSNSKGKDGIYKSKNPQFF